MEVKLLRMDIDEAKNTPPENDRVGQFWVVAPHFDECFPIFKEIFFNEKITEIKSEECTITRCENGFFVQDPYDGKDTFTHEEVSLFIDLWEKAQKVVPNTVDIRMFPMEDGYDITVDYLGKLYHVTKSENIMSIVSGMPLTENGKSVDPAMLECWNNAFEMMVEKTSAQNYKIRQICRLSEKTLTAKQIYEAMLNFMGTYNYITEITSMLNRMRLLGNGESMDPNMWNYWVKSVDKISSQNPRVRPLFLLLNSKVLNIEDVYFAMFDWLNEYCYIMQAGDIKNLIKNMQLFTTSKPDNSGIVNAWQKAIPTALKNQSNEKVLGTTEAYNIVIKFLDAYNHKVHSNEIVTLLDRMKILNDLESTDPVAWNSWLESVNKTLNKYRKF